jgi:hypothetical protein
MFQQQQLFLLLAISSSSSSFVESSLFGNSASSSAGGIRGGNDIAAANNDSEGDDTPSSIIPSSTKIIIDSTLYQDDDERLITYTCIEDNSSDSEITCDWYIMVPMDKDETEEEMNNPTYQTSYTTSILEDARSIIDSTLFEEEDDDANAKNRLVSYTCLSSSVDIDQNFYDGGIICDWFIMVPMTMEEDQ